MALRYPIDGTGDWVTFQAHNYRSNNPRGTGGDGQRVGEDIVLYMPNSTPPIKNGQTWKSTKFEGPMGVAAREIGVGITSAVTGNATIESIKQAAGQINLPGIIQQGAIQAAGKFAGTTANQIMSLSTGKVFNPNIELLYEGPNVRSFDFNFSFIPKDEAEAAIVASIILQFKRLSAPLNVGQMYEIPKVWQVSYSGDGGSWMNKFKKAAMNSITVQYNAGLDQHATFSNGFPIRTDIQMEFVEVDVITRDDHKGPMGY